MGARGIWPGVLGEPRGLLGVALFGMPDRGESNLRALCDVRDAAELARLAARRVVLMV